MHILGELVVEPDGLVFENLGLLLLHPFEQPDLPLARAPADLHAQLDDRAQQRLDLRRIFFDRLWGVDPRVGRELDARRDALDDRPVHHPDVVDVGPRAGPENLVFVGALDAAQDEGELAWLGRLHGIGHPAPVGLAQAQFQRLRLAAQDLCLHGQRLAFQYLDIPGNGLELDPRRWQYRGRRVEDARDSRSRPRLQNRDEGSANDKDDGGGDQEPANRSRVRDVLHLETRETLARFREEAFQERRIGLMGIRASCEVK